MRVIAGRIRARCRVCAAGDCGPVPAEAAIAGPAGEGSLGRDGLAAETQGHPGADPALCQGQGQVPQERQEGAEKEGEETAGPTTRLNLVFLLILCLYGEKQEERRTHGDVGALSSCWKD